MQAKASAIGAGVNVSGRGNISVFSLRSFYICIYILFSCLICVTCFVLCCPLFVCLWSARGMSGLSHTTVSTARCAPNGSYIDRMRLYCICWTIWRLSKKQVTQHYKLQLVFLNALRHAPVPAPADAPEKHSIWLWGFLFYFTTLTDLHA